ncbi:MAG: Uncharacterized protein JWP80_2019 [Pseudomonas sp.]|nr:Uncharacterized protein [Pseudomonas sp.]
MNSQRLAQMGILPLHIQQGLFASLALLATLIVGQQFEHWTSHAQEAVQIHHPFVTGRTYSTVSATASKEPALSFQPAQETAPQAEQPHQPSWVF